MSLSVLQPLVPPVHWPSPIAERLVTYDASDVIAPGKHTTAHFATRHHRIGGCSRATLVTAALVLPTALARHRRAAGLRRVAATATGVSQSLAKYIKKASDYPEYRPKEGDRVKIHYVGKLEDGTVFDSSRARGEPFEFTLGDNEVIDGWEMLISTMALGERCDLVIPPEHAYGEAGMPPIVPENATLTFDIELMDIGSPIEDEDEDDEDDDFSSEDAQGSEVFWEKDDEREGGLGPGYKWEATASGSEICITVPMKKDVTLKQIKVSFRTNSLTCRIGPKTFIDGDIFAAVDSDDSHWDVEKESNRVNLLIYLVKLDTRLKWDRLLKGVDGAADVEVVDVDEALRVANEQTQPEIFDVDAAKARNEQARGFG